MPKYFRYFPTVEYNGKVVTDISRRVKIAEELSADPYLFMPYTITDDMRPEDVAYYYYGDVDKVWMVYLANNIIDPYTQWPLPSDSLELSIQKKYSRATLTFGASAVDVTNDAITIVDHQYKTTDPVIYSTDGTAIGGLVNGSTYYVVRVGADTIKLSTSATNAINSTTINLTTVGSGNHKIDRDITVYLNSTTIYTNVIEVVNNTDPNIKTTFDSYLYNTSLIQSEWTPVRAYEYEIEQNENKRTIWLINKDYAYRVENDLRDLMND